jgi:AraC-like DNA-binding protein
MISKPQSEQSKMWRIPKLDGVELLHGKNLTQSFPLHTHEEYAIGVIEQGALGYFYRGENVVASQGDINLCIPGEAHTGQPAIPEGWSYRMFYFNPEFLRTIAAQSTERACDIPFFQPGVIANDTLAGQLFELHVQLENVDIPSLEQESVLLEVLAKLIQQHADKPCSERKLGHEPRSVKQIKHYLEHHYTDEVSLERLSEITQLSRYYLIRVFREQVGIPPHAYLRQVRIKHAKRLLVSGQTLANAAHASGFTDQSHLTRWFKRLTGITPGQYRNSVQDSPK